jgi:hypothetical protein
LRNFKTQKALLQGTALFRAAALLCACSMRSSLRKGMIEEKNA